MLGIMQYISFILIIITNLCNGADCELTWSKRVDENLPTSSVQVVVGDKTYKLGDTASSENGVVSKDGKFCIVSLVYDSNLDGIINFNDSSKIIINQIIDNGIKCVNEIAPATGMFDINSDSTKFTYIGGKGGKMFMNKINLNTNEEINIIDSATWLGHVSISANDKWCAFYMSTEKFDNRVVVCDENGGKIISNNVGNGWSLMWMGDILIFKDNNLSDTIYYDPVNDKRISIKELSAVNFINKKKSGWPKIDSKKQ